MKKTTQKPTFQSHVCDQCDKALTAACISLNLNNYSGLKEDCGKAWIHTVRYKGVFEFCDHKCLAKFFTEKAMRKRGDQTNYVPFITNTHTNYPVRKQPYQDNRKPGNYTYIPRVIPKEFEDEDVEDMPAPARGSDESGW